MNHIQSMTRDQRRAAIKFLKEQSKLYPAHLIEISRDEWPNTSNPKLIEVWRSKDYCVQVFQERYPVAVRLSINRTRINADGTWQEDIPWVDLQRLKRESGYGRFDAVEVFPCDQDVVNVANMRHLFVMEQPLGFAWRKA